MNYCRLIERLNENKVTLEFLKLSKRSEKMTLGRVKQTETADAKLTEKRREIKKDRAIRGAA